MAKRSSHQSSLLIVLLLLRFGYLISKMIWSFEGPLSCPSEDPSRVRRSSNNPPKHRVERANRRRGSISTSSRRSFSFGANCSWTFATVRRPTSLSIHVENWSESTRLTISRGKDYHRGRRFEIHSCCLKVYREKRTERQKRKEILLEVRRVCWFLPRKMVKMSVKNRRPTWFEQRRRRREESGRCLRDHLRAFFAIQHHFTDWQSNRPLRCFQVSNYFLRKIFDVWTKTNVEVEDRNKHRALTDRLAVQIVRSEQIFVLPVEIAEKFRQIRRNWRKTTTNER